ncbi:ribbon-helix-helix domain-containing protein [Kribbella sp. CA-294648]|uniref:ribbon-helix-helix domain-containing protein n=1 Tax=Kribbella sp. CA-294648 TaxID=3239948 RepID=UPI003D8D24F1
MSEKDYDAVAEWAEHDMTLARDAEKGLCGQEAAAFGRELVERSQGGRPSIDPDAAPGEKSPIRQVRLPRALNADLDAFARNHHRNASDVLREALSEYLAAHKDAS